MLRWKSSLKPAAAAAADYKSTVLADSPLFYYRLGESSGSTAYDEVAASSNGTYYNTPTLGQTGAISGDSNTSVLFEEANQESARTTILSSETSLLPCTIECFVKCSGASDSNGGIVFIRGTTPASGLNIIGTTLGKLGYHWRGQSNTYFYDPGITLSDNTWYYVALVVESTKATFYVIDESGTLTTATNSVTHSAIDVSANRWHIARDPTSNRYFQGYIDEVAVYDQALSQSTLVAHAAAAGYTAGSTDITLENSAVTTASSFSTPTNIDVNIPAVSADDILLLFSTTNDFSEPTDSPPAGWTKIVEKDGTTSSQSTVAAYWKRASSAAAATTETWSSFFPNGELYYIWVGAYSGCITGESPIDAYGTAAIGFASPWSVDVTTTVANTMIVTISGTTQSSVTYTWTDGTELIDTAYGGDAAVSINEKLESTSGAKTRTTTPSTTTGCSMIAVALKPVSSGPTYVYEEDFEAAGTPSGFTNTIVGSGTIDYDYTTDPGSGSESLEVVTSGGDSFAELDFGAIYDNFELIFQNKIASGGSNRTWIVLSDDSNYTSPDHIVIGNVSGWDYGFNHNYNAITRSTTGVSLGSWHWAKLNVDIPNTTITLTISASSDFSSADVATTTSQTFGSSFGGVRYARFGGRNKDMTVLVDSITLEDLS